MLKGCLNILFCSEKGVQSNFADNGCTLSKKKKKQNKMPSIFPLFPPLFQNVELDISVLASEHEIS